MTTRSCWRDDNPDLIEAVVSRRELHLLQRLRMLESGTHAVFVVKTRRGRDGLEKFKVQEALPVPE